MSLSYYFNILGGGFVVLGGLMRVGIKPKKRFECFLSHLYLYYFFYNNTQVLLSIIE
ncbi:hypothetical protein bcgnr5388_36300 [Bacillus cereus]